MQQAQTEMTTRERDRINLQIIRKAYGLSQPLQFVGDEGRRSVSEMQDRVFACCKPVHF